MNEQFEYVKNIEQGNSISKEQLETNADTTTLNKTISEIGDIVKSLDKNLKDKFMLEWSSIGQISKKLEEIYDDGKKPKLWIFGCSMSNKHLLETHDETWYSLLADKLGMELMIRSHEGYGINAIERTIVSELSNINPKKDLVVFSPSFWHRVYIVEFKDGRRGFYPNETTCSWYSDMRDLDEIQDMNYERWISICELFVKLGINFRTWLLNSPIIESYPFERAKRISKFESYILKPKLAIQTLDWMSFQKKHPEYWFCSDKGKEDYHFNLKGHKYISGEFYNQIKGIKPMI